MTTNQAFNTLSNIAGPHAARIICDAIPKMSSFRLWRISHALTRGVPVAKIIHNKWFYGLQFYTNKWTLDPRPDTETLVDAVLTDYPHTNKIYMADLGTGTACIICAITKNMNASGIGLEKSRKALRVAQKNINNLGLGDKVSVRHGDFGNIKTFAPNTFDLIVSNPPYIAHGDKRVNLGATHDPKMALFAKHNGLAAYEQIAKNAKIWLRNNGRIYLEIGIDMTEPVRNIFELSGWKFIKSVRDLGDITRVMVFENMK